MRHFRHRGIPPPAGVIFTRNSANPLPRLVNKKEVILETDGLPMISLISPLKFREILEIWHRLAKPCSES